MSSSFVTVAATFVGMMGLAHADTEPPSPLTVAIYGNYMPLHGEDSRRVPTERPTAAAMLRKRAPVGFEVDVARLLADALDREVVFINTRDAFGSGALDAVRDGKVDIGMNSITVTDARREKVDFTTPYLELQYGIAGLRPWPATDRPPTTRFVTASGLAAAALQYELPGAQVEQVATSGAAVERVLEGGADWLVEEEVGLRLLTQDNDLVVGDWAFGRSSLAIATPKGQVTAIEQALLSVKESPAYQDALVRWQLDDPPSSSAATDAAAVNGQLRSALLGLGSMSWASMRRTNPNGYEEHGCDRGLVWFQFLDDASSPSMTGGYTKESASMGTSTRWVSPSPEWARYITADGLSAEQLSRGSWHVLYAPLGGAIQIARVVGVDDRTMSGGLRFRVVAQETSESMTLTFGWVDRNRHIGSWTTDHKSRSMAFGAVPDSVVLNRGDCDDDTEYQDDR